VQACVQIELNTETNNGLDDLIETMLPLICYCDDSTGKAIHQAHQQ
jgi:hypothetical protein